MADAPSAFQIKVLANLCQGIDSIYNDRLLCDLKVTVGQVTFDCHLLVMAAVSGFFQSLMSSPWQESHTGQVELKHDDVTAESFQMLLDILYKTKEVITMQTARDVLRMSVFLQVKASLTTVLITCSHSTQLTVGWLLFINMEHSVYPKVGCPECGYTHNDRRLRHWQFERV